MDVCCALRQKPQPVRSRSRVGHPLWARGWRAFFIANLFSDGCVTYGRTGILGRQRRPNFQFHRRNSSNTGNWDREMKPEIRKECGGILGDTANPSGLAVAGGRGVKGVLPKSPARLKAGRAGLSAPREVTKTLTFRTSSDARGPLRGCPVGNRSRGPHDPPRLGWSRWFILALLSATSCC